jgi:hypothetical protein
MFEFCAVHIKISPFHLEVIEFIFSPFMAHDVLECFGKFCHDCVPYEFVSFVFTLANVPADDFYLVVDPIANLGSSHEGEKQHSTLQWSRHDSGLIVERSIHVPFCEEVFNFGPISIKDFRLSS